MQRIVFVVVCGLAVLGIFGGVAQAAANPPGTTDPVTQVKQNKDVRVKMSDGVSIDTDEYIPTTGCPCPVIIIQTPYRKSGSAVGMYNSYFPTHGYAEIVVDVRGTGSSEGYWTSFGPLEQHDGGELVRYATRRPFSNGKIGLAGVSYAAINQFLTVEQLAKPEFNDVRGAVKAIFPIVPMSDPYRDVVFAGGNTDTGFIPLWLGLVNGLNAIPADDNQKNPSIALNAESQHLVDVGTFGAQAVGDATLGSYEHQLPAQAQTFPDQAYDGPYYRNVAPISRIQDVHVPTFIVGGEYDIFQRGEPLLYRGLNLQPTQKKLVYGPWYHGSPSANLTADDGSTPVRDQQGHLLPSTNNLSLAWFDHWIKGFNNNIENYPTVETYQIGRGAWSADTAFPAAGTHYQPWYLNGAASGSGAQAILDGGIATTSGAAGSAQVPWQPLTGECSRSSTQWTAGIVAAGSCPSDNSSAEITGLSFTSQPFKKDYTISGPILADVWASSTRPDTTLIATVTDVAPDGKVSDRVTAGSMVASLNQTTTTPCTGGKVQDCSVYRDGVSIIPWHPYTYQSRKPLAAGTPTELKIEVFPTSAVFQKGHRLRVSITTGDLPHQGPNASTLADSTGGIDTIYFGGKTPSAVYLGTVGAGPVGQQGTRAIAAAAPAAPAAAPGVAAAVPAGPAGAVAISAARPVGTRLPVNPVAAAAGLGTVGLLAAAGYALYLRRRRSLSPA